MTDTPVDPVPVDLTDKTLPPYELLTAIGARVQGIEKNGGDILAGIQKKSTRQGWLIVGVIVGLAIALPSSIVAIRASTAAQNATHKSNVTAAAQIRADAQDTQDRCNSGNELRAAIVSVSRGTVEYIDALLAAFGSLTDVSKLTPEQQAKSVEAGGKIAAVREAQLAKLNDPSLMPKDCEALYPVPKLVAP